MAAAAENSSPEIKKACKSQMYCDLQAFFCSLNYNSAMTSISASTFFGSALTATQERAGLLVK